MRQYTAAMNTLTQAIGVAMVFVLIFPTALVNVVLALLLLSYCLGGGYRDKWRRIRENPVAMASLALMSLFIVGVSYSPVGLRSAIGSLNSYRELILLPVMISLFTEARWQQRAYYAFLASIAVAVSLSFAMRFGWLPAGQPGQEWVPFKASIAYGFFLAFAAYLMIHQAIRSTSVASRTGWAVLSILTAIDLLFLVSGRTGHVVFLVLLILLCCQFWHLIRKRWLVFALAGIIAVTAVISTSPAIKSRSHDIDLATTNMAGSSIGLRLIFWQTSLRIVADHPLAGAGTGSFAAEYARRNDDHPSILADNPHNEYLMIASQIGIIGLAGWLFLLFRQWRQTSGLESPYRTAAQGLVVAMAVGCLFNSFLRDHGEGHFFAIYAGVLFASVAGRSAGQPFWRCSSGVSGS